MADKPYNPPIHPTPEMHTYGGTLEAQRGMTLRDYFAAKAMQAMISGCLMNGKKLKTEEDYTTVTTCAYEMADFMLTERQKS